MPKVVRWMVTLREPPVGVLAQAPISALSATQLAVRRKRATVFFRIVFTRSGCLVYSFRSDFICCLDQVSLDWPEKSEETSKARA
jgi:hypothetical protein